MEILFDDDDLEPAVPSVTAAPPSVPAESSASSPSEDSLFGTLEEQLGLEPVFAPAPAAAAGSGRGPVPPQDPWRNAREGAGCSGPVRKAPSGTPRLKPADSLFPPEEVPEPEHPFVGRGRRRKTETAASSRPTGSADAFAVVRDDGTVLEVDRDTCADPEVFANERRRRRGGREHAGRPEKPGRNLLTRAVDALSRREYSRRDLGRKLAADLAEGETREDVTEALDRLEALGLLSDARYAQACVHAGAGRLGNARLRRELRRSGVSDELIDEALESVEEPEEVRAWRMWSRRWSEPPKDWKERERMTRFLMTRGFSMSAIQKVLHGEVDPDAC